MHMIAIIFPANIENLADIKANAQNYPGWGELLVAKRFVDRTGIPVLASVIKAMIRISA